MSRTKGHASFENLETPKMKSKNIEENPSKICKWLPVLLTVRIAKNEKKI